jgi:YjbE family integral membrane protein
LRVLFVFFVVWLMAVPYLKAVGGALLLWIGVKLLQGEEEHEAGHGGGAHASLWGAIRTIVIADAVMSLDNVIAIAAASRGDTVLLVLGLLISIPLVVFGSQLILKVLIRWPILVVAGGALLGWIAGDVTAKDPAFQPWIDANAYWLHHAAPAAGAAFVVAVGLLVKRRAKAKARKIRDLAAERKA